MREGGGGGERVRSGEETWRVVLLTWRVPLKFRECCCIQLLLVVRGFVVMATQSCAPAQGRSSSAELSSVLHIGCTDRQTDRGRGGGGLQSGQ